MTLFDIFALCAIGLSVVLAMMRGLVGEVLSLVSWVLSLIAAKMAAQPLAETVFSFIRPSVLAAVAGFIAAFAVVTLAVLVCAFTDLPKSDEWQNAYSSLFFEGAASVAVPYLPEYLAKKVSYPSF